MYSSSINSKGQITLPNEIRTFLGLKAGDKIAFSIEDGRVVLFKKLAPIETSFGICKPRKSVNLKNIEKAIRTKGGEKG